MISNIIGESRFIKIFRQHYSHTIDLEWFSHKIQKSKLTRWQVAWRKQQNSVLWCHNVQNCIVHVTSCVETIPLLRVLRAHCVARCVLCGWRVSVDEAPASRDQHMSLGVTARLKAVIFGSVTPIPSCLAGILNPHLHWKCLRQHLHVLAPYLCVSALRFPLDFPQRQHSVMSDVIRISRIAFQ